MLKRHPTLVLFLIPLLMTGCTVADFVEKLTPQEESNFAKKSVLILKQGKLDALKRTMPDTLKSNPQINHRLKEVADIFPYEKPISIRVIAYNSQFTSAMKEAELILRYQFPSKWVQAQIMIKQINSGPLELWGIYAQEIPEPNLESENLTPYIIGAGIFFAFVLFFLVWLVRRKR